MTLPILIAPGDRVRVVSGPLEGSTGSVLGTDELPAGTQLVVPDGCVPVLLDPKERGHYAAIPAHRVEPLVAAALDSAATAIVGKSAGELNQALADEVERHPDPDVLDPFIENIHLGGEGGES